MVFTISFSLDSKQQSLEDMYYATETPNVQYLLLISYFLRDCNWNIISCLSRNISNIFLWVVVILVKGFLALKSLCATSTKFESKSQVCKNGKRLRSWNFYVKNRVFRYSLLKFIISSHRFALMSVSISVRLVQGVWGNWVVSWWY
jgi:hypothetical protein